MHYLWNGDDTISCEEHALVVCLDATNEGFGPGLALLRGTWEITTPLPTSGGRTGNPDRWYWAVLSSGARLTGRGMLAVAMSLPVGSRTVPITDRLFAHDEHGISDAAVAAVLDRPLGHPRITYKPWGYEMEPATGVDRWFSTSVMLKLIRVDHFHSTSRQYHTHKSEARWDINADGTLGKWEPSYPGDIHRVKGPATYFEISTFHPSDVVRMDDQYGRAL